MCAEPASLRSVRKRFTLDRAADAVDPALRRELMNRLAPDMARLEGLLGRSLDGWRLPEPEAARDNVVWLDLRPRRLTAPARTLQGTDA